MGFSDDARDRWYLHHHWQLRRVRDLSGRHEIHVWFPPDDRKKIAEEMSDKERPKPKLRATKNVADTPHTWLSMLTAWYHLRERGAPMEPTERFTLDHFLDRFFADWERAASILAHMAKHDQSEIMKHFEIEKLHARARNALQRGRADYLAQQAQREPDPLALDG